MTCFEEIGCLACPAALSIRLSALVVVSLLPIGWAWLLTSLTSLVWERSWTAQAVSATECTYQLAPAPGIVYANGEQQSSMP